MITCDRHAVMWYIIKVWQKVSHLGRAVCAPPDSHFIHLARRMLHVDGEGRDQLTQDQLVLVGVIQNLNEPDNVGMV